MRRQGEGRLTLFDGRHRDERKVVRPVRLSAPTDAVERERKIDHGVSVWCIGSSIGKRMKKEKRGERTYFRTCSY